MQVIDVAVVLDGGVAAAGAVLVRVVLRDECAMSISPSSAVRRRGRLQFGGVRQRVMNQIGNVPIREGVIDVVAVPPPDDQPFRAQNAQPLRHGRELLARPPPRSR